MKSKILVIGDSCMDVHVYCKSERLCPDKPVPVLEVINKVENPGMARNVYENLKSLKANVDICDNENWCDVTKTRYIHEPSNHMFFRLDSKNKIDRIKKRDIEYSYDHIVISDYNKGFLSEDDIEEICSNHKSVFLDSKKLLGPWAEKASFIKINDHEYRRSEQYITERIAERLIMTAGKDGCYYKGQNYPVKELNVIDVSGAGDAFFAGLVFKYAIKKDIISAIKFANKCSSKVVQERGVTTV